MEKLLVTAHVVTFNNRNTIVSCIESLLHQEQLEPEVKLDVCVTDNSSSDGTPDLLRAVFGSRISLHCNDANLGFAAAQNEGCARALAQNSDYVFLFNPDAALAPGALRELVNALQEDSSSGSACPKLLRSNESLLPLDPPIIDAAGMYFTPALRHFDRGSSEQDNGCFETKGYVFGASGAAILLRRSFIYDVSITPEGSLGGVELFDSEFFAYREDADLAWRAQWLGWRCLYVPTAIGYHLRRVLPERRHTLPSQINLWSVRNRFLMQLNNISLLANFHCLLPALWRNLLVFAACLLQERSSLPAFWQAVKLAPRALRRRKKLMARRRVSPLDMSKFFSRTPYFQPSLNKDVRSNKIRSLGIAIINYNSGQLLAKCLKHLLANMQQLNKHLEVSVLIFDNASSDQSAERLKHLFHHTSQVKFILSEKNLGFAAAINRSAEQLDCDALLILNPDIQINAENILELVNALNSFNKLGAVAPALYNEDGSPQNGFMYRAFPSISATLAELFFLQKLIPNNPWTQNYRQTNNYLGNRALGSSCVQEVNAPSLPPSQPLVVEQPAGACLLITKEAFSDLSGFDEQFFPAWFEDVDFCKRLRERGFLAAIVYQAAATHQGGYSVRTLGPGVFYKIWYRNMFRYWQKHGSTRDWAIFRLCLPLALILRGLIFGLDWIFPGPAAQETKEDKYLRAAVFFELFRELSYKAITSKNIKGSK